MTYFGSTVEERINQEINVIANKAEAELKPLRKRYLESLSDQDRTGIPPFYYVRRMQIILHDASNKMAAVEQHWNRRRA